MLYDDKFRTKYLAIHFRSDFHPNINTLKFMLTLTQILLETPYGSGGSKFSFMLIRDTRTLRSGIPYCAEINKNNVHRSVVTNTRRQPMKHQFNNARTKLPARLIIKKWVKTTLDAYLNFCIIYLWL